MQLHLYESFHLLIQPQDYDQSNYKITVDGTLWVPWRILCRF